jgi:hypothetical protein
MDRATILGHDLPSIALRVLAWSSKRTDRKLPAAAQRITFSKRTDIHLPDTISSARYDDGRLVKARTTLALMFNALRIARKADR